MLITNRRKIKLDCRSQSIDNNPRSGCMPEFTVLGTKSYHILIYVQEWAGAPRKSMGLQDFITYSQNWLLFV